jgi:sulfur relay (sulfurtransferase) complex TusBCD TusD component (DsrE family)
MEPTKKYLVVINDAPYGNERPYNALLLSGNNVWSDGSMLLALQSHRTINGMRQERRG